MKLTKHASIVVSVIFGIQTIQTATLAESPADKATTSGDWTTWTPRPEIAPEFSKDAKEGRSGKNALKISCPNDAAAFGAWKRRVTGIQGGQCYQLTAFYKAKGIKLERRSVSARLDWLDQNGGRARPPDYALDVGAEADWTKIEHFAVAPDNAQSVVIELILGWAPLGVVWWDDIELSAVESPPKRMVRVMTVYHRPRNTKSTAESVEEFCRLIESDQSLKPDIICLPEGITIVGTGKDYAEVSESIPGPTSRRLGKLAKQLNAYIAAGIYERTNHIVYNTALLIGRDGGIAGAYRKTHLPREEVEAGITPGNSYPVFETDFGKVGLMICWDVQFPEPARGLAARGAELILLPIWGGNEVLARARAIENHIYLVSSSYDMKSYIVDPTGEVLSEATKEKPVVTVDIDLDRKIIQPWLGDMKPRTWREWRPDIPVW